MAVIRTEAQKHPHTLLLIAAALALLITVVIGTIRVTNNKTVVPEISGITARNTAPVTTNPVIASSAVEIITAENLVKELMADKNRYAKETTLRVSGIYEMSGMFDMGDKLNLRFGPGVDDFGVWASLIVGSMAPESMLTPKEIKAEFLSLKPGDEVVIEGQYSRFSNIGVVLENCKIVSKVPK